MPETGHYTTKEILELHQHQHKTEEETHARVHLMEKEARSRELALADEKFARANKVREQIDQERGSFVTAKELRAELASLVTRVGTMEMSQSKTSGQLSGAWILVIVIATATSIISTVISVIHMLTK